jgi:C4-dicarboxylate-specific signal transduction histidine kinase
MLTTASSRSSVASLKTVLFSTLLELTRGAAVKNSVSVRAQLADGLPLLQGDRVQLQQVVLNLIINPVEAMSDIGDGARELLISSETIESGGVLVTVRDSGPALTPATLGRVFESIYTTKSSGMGAGAVDLPFDRRSPRRTLVGEHERSRGATFQFTVPAAEGM